MNEKRIRKFIKKHEQMVNFLLVCIGLLCVVLGHIFDIDFWGNFLREVGFAFITNALLLFSNVLYFKNDDVVDEAKELFERDGLLRIYKEKREMNNKINNELLPNYNPLEYDIICCGGLTTLLREQGSKLIEYIKKNKMRIRILTANPNLEYLLQKKIDEDYVMKPNKDFSTTPISNEIRNSIFLLNNWVIEEKAKLPDHLQTNLEIRFYNTLPPIQYHRVGNSVFIGQSLIGASSQSSPAFEFINTNNPNDFFCKYTQYFESLWVDPNITQNKPNVKLNPKVIIDNNIINNILLLSCSDIASDLGDNLANRIGALFTICGYPKPLPDGKERRFNTNIVRGGEIINIQNSNGVAINGEKIGYYAHDPNQVVGRCIRDSEIKFEITREQGRYSILAIPFKNYDNKIVAAITYEFDSDFNKKLKICDNDAVGNDIGELNKKIIDKAEKWARLLLIYLHL